MDALEKPAALPAVRSDDQLIQAIVNGSAPHSCDPTEARLIRLLTNWRSWITQACCDDAPSADLRRAGVSPLCRPLDGPDLVLPGRATWVQSCCCRRPRTGGR